MAAMYELFVLGELMDQDKHGYVLQERLGFAIGPSKKISPGTLYPLLSRLEENGWIELMDHGVQEKGKARKRYGITEKGRSRFMELMDRPVEPNSDIGLAFQFQLTYAQFVPLETRLQSCSRYEEHLRAELDYIRSMSEMLAAKMTDARLLRQVLRMLDHRRHVAEADMAWVQWEVQSMKAGEEQLK